MISCEPASSQDQENGLISAEELKTRLDAGLDGVLLDLRTPGEVANGIIPGAKVIDFRSSDFKDQINALDKNEKYYVYCHGGGRSAKTKTIMEQLGFESVLDYGGGFSEWSSLGYPLVDAPK
ncbi:MAG: rhodanese-like domain-containing protein [Bacteroidota bacterium]